jgi:hemerythrin superfamily protein
MKVPVHVRDGGATLNRQSHTSTRLSVDDAPFISQVLRAVARPLLWRHARRGVRSTRLALGGIQHSPFFYPGVTMATRQKGRGASSSTEQGAIEMLMADHKKVKKLFSDFKKLKDDGSNEEKAAIVDRICNELKVHATIEEEIFYPAVRKQIDDSDLMDEALVEHAGAKDLIAQLEEMGADDDLYDAKVTVLGEQIDHHVKEEEGDMFKKAKKANVDTAALGATMLKRKQALMTELGLSAEEEEAAMEVQDA